MTTEKNKQWRTWLADDLAEWAYDAWKAGIEEDMKMAVNQSEKLGYIAKLSILEEWRELRQWRAERHNER